MLRASIDLLGLYNFDNTILNGLKLPTDEEGTELIDRSELVDNLLMETAELELVYGSAPFMKTAITAWSAKQVGVWHKLYDTMHFEYNPIWNKDGAIDETITHNLAGTDYRTQDITRSDDFTRTDNLSHSEDYTRTDYLKHTDDATTTTDVYGYNSSTAAPKTKVTVDNDTSDTGTQRNAGTTSNTGTQRNAGSSREAGYDNHDTSDTGTITTSRTEQGNIGLTSTQELIKQERDIVQFNVMDYIINDFKRRFCLMVY